MCSAAEEKRTLVMTSYSDVINIVMQGANVLVNLLSVNTAAYRK